jgi:hypothetical protein
LNKDLQIIGFYKVGKQRFRDANKMLADQD